MRFPVSSFRFPELDADWKPETGNWKLKLSQPFSVRASPYENDVNHPLAVIHSTRRNEMRKLSYLFMALSLLCFAVPAFAQGGEAAGTNWVAITAGFSMAIASGLCALASGESHAVRGRGLGAQSRRPSRHSAGADSWSGADRVPGALHAGYYLRQGEVRRFRKIEKPLLASRGFFCFGWVLAMSLCAGRPTRLPWFQASAPASPSECVAAGSGSPDRYSQSRIRLR